MRERERERDAHTGGSEANNSAELFNNYTFESSFVVEPRSLDGLVGWRRLVGKVYNTHHSSTKTSIVCCFSLYCCCSKEKGKRLLYVLIIFIFARGSMSKTNFFPLPPSVSPFFPPFMYSKHMKEYASDHGYGG